MATTEILDLEYAAALEANLRQIPGIDKAVVVIREDTERARLNRLSVTDLVPKIEPPAQRPQTEDGQTILFDAPQAGTVHVPMPAIRHGAKLIIPANAPVTLPQALQLAAASAPHRGVIYVHPDGTEDFQSYPQLIDDAQRILAGLRRLGLKPGDRVIFQLDSNRGFISCHWACLMGAFVQVPISIAPTYAQRNLTVNKLVNTWESLNHPVILSTEALKPSLDELAAREGLPNFNVQAVETLMTNAPDADWARSSPEDVVIFLLTSGSTGTPKLVQQTHHSLLCRTLGTITLNGFTAADISLNWMPLDHVGGIVMFHLRDVYLGCLQIQVPTQMILEKPLTWLDLVHKHRVSSTWAPNFAYGLINNRLDKEDQHSRWDLSSLRSILNGGEAVVAKTARRFLTLLAPYGLPADSMQPAWGMSETCSGTTHSLRFSLGATSDADQFVSVGEAIPGFSMRIVDDQQQVVPESVIGHLQVHGDPVTSGYYNNPKANQEAFTADGWFDTGDLGIISDGQLTITGRGKGEIIINGVNYYSHEIESVVESVDGVDVSFTAASAVRGEDDDTDKLAIFFHPISADWDHQVEVVNQIRQKLVKAFGIYADYVLPLEKEDVPKTAIGKIQRSRLAKQLLEGDYDDKIKKFRTLGRLGDTVPDWFYRKCWLPAVIQPREHAVGQEYWLIFADTLGLAAHLARALDRTGGQYVWIEAGEGFTRHSDQRFAISPDIPEHYDRLLAALDEQNIKVDTIVHSWGYGTDGASARREAIRTAHAKGIHSLRHLIQSLDKKRIIPNSAHLYVATSLCQAPPTDTPVAYEKGTLPGFIKVLVQEVPWLKCRHVDFEGTEGDGQHLLDEISAPGEDREIAYRDGRRMIGRLSKIDLLSEPAGRLPIVQDGLYLLTGGLGGVGGYIAQQLMTRFGSKLILTGRTQLPESATRSTAPPKDDPAASKIAMYQKIAAVSRRTGCDFVYQTADAADAEAIKRVAAEAEAKWDLPLAGVFHMAGELNPARHWAASESHKITAEDTDAYEAMFQAKAYGTCNLMQLVQERPEAIFVGFSSVVSELGGATFGAYCAGNSFLEACCRSYQKRFPGRVFCFSWSMWKDTGMNRDNPLFAQQAALGMGNMVIDPEEGWNSMLAGLCRQTGPLLVGLNGYSAHIRSLLNEQPQMPKRADIYVSTSMGDAWRDALGEQLQTALQDLTSPYDIIRVDRIPVLENGVVDLQALQQHLAGQAIADTGGGVPATAAEQKIAEIWREVLGIKTIDVHMNFFDCGGTSIQLAQVNGRLKEAFDREISITDLFQYPAISSLAAFLAATDPDSSSDELAQSKQRGEHRRAKMLRRRRSTQATTKGNQQE